MMKLAILAICLAYSIALIPGNTSPLIISGLISGLGLGIADSGRVLSCELAVMGIVATLLAPRMPLLNARRVCLAGALLQLTGHVLAAASNHPDLLLLYRALAGAGGGTVIAAVNATIAGAPNATRLYGLTMMAPPLIGALVALLMSRAIAAFAHAGAFGSLALLSLVALPFLFAFPDYRKKLADPEHSKLPYRGAGLALLLATFLTGASMMAYFAFVERLGVRLELSIEAIGNVFAVVVIAGALGAGIAALIANRFGLFLPLMIGILLHSFAMLLVLEVMALPVYIGGTVLEGITLVYTLSFLFAAAARLDAQGRWAAAAGGAFSLSLGAGPWLGGALIEYAGFTALSVLIVSCTMCISLLLLWIKKPIDSSRATT